MKERPILFSAQMVRAILEGRKTQARRALKIQPIHCTELPFILFPQSKDEAIEQTGFIWPNAKEQILALCPYGQPGDRLWVRETWQGPLLGTAGDYKAFNAGGQKAIQKPECCVYRATDTLNAVDDDGRELGWRPSIHMPRWASRISLEITGVRIERLADLSKDDAMAEGISIQPDGGFGLADSTHYNFSDPTDSFASLWESINGAGSWMANPWVWVVEFKQIKETA